MKFPDKAVVVANNKDELIELMLFFDAHCVCWPSGRRCSEVVDIIWQNKSVRAHGEATAINIAGGMPDGYCWPEYYHESALYLSDDPEWNFISVPDFIGRIDGVGPSLQIAGLL